MSSKFSLNLVDLKKVAIHAAMFAVGVIVLEVVRQVGLVDFGIYQPVANLVAGAIADAVRKYLQGK